MIINLLQRNTGKIVNNKIKMYYILLTSTTKFKKYFIYNFEKKHKKSVFNLGKRIATFLFKKPELQAHSTIPLHTHKNKRTDDLDDGDDKHVTTDVFLRMLVKKVNN